MKNRYAILLATLCMFAFINVRADEQATVTLAFHHTKGKVYHYKSETNSTQGGRPLIWTSLTDVTIKKVKPNRNVVCETVFTKVKFSAPGQETDLTPFPKENSTFDPTGKLIDFEKGISEAGPRHEVDYIETQLLNPLFPDHPVKSGDTWKTKIENPLIQDAFYFVKTTFIGNAEVKGKKVWKIKQIGDVKTDDKGQILTVSATFFLDPDDGRIVKLDANMDNQPSPNGSINSYKITTTLLETDE